MRFLQRLGVCELLPFAIKDQKFTFKVQGLALEPLGTDVLPRLINWEQAVLSSNMCQIGKPLAGCSLTVCLCCESVHQKSP